MIVSSIMFLLSIAGWYLGGRIWAAGHHNLCLPVWMLAGICLLLHLRLWPEHKPPKARHRR